MPPRRYMPLLLGISWVTGYAQVSFKDKTDSLLYARGDSAFSLSLHHADSALSEARQVMKQARAPLQKP